MRAVDTNLLVRLITNDDEAQARVAEEFIAGREFNVAPPSAGWAVCCLASRGRADWAGSGPEGRCCG